MVSFSVGQASTGTNRRVWTMKNGAFFSVGQASTGTNRWVWKVKSVFLSRTNEYWYESTSMEISEKCLFL